MWPKPMIPTVRLKISLDTKSGAQLKSWSSSIRWLNSPILRFKYIAWVTPISAIARGE